MEWIQSDGKRELGSVLETLPLTEAYDRFLREKYPPTKRRKLDADHKPASSSVTCGSISKTQSTQPSERERQPAPPPTPPQDPPSGPETPPSTHSIPTTTDEPPAHLSQIDTTSVTAPFHFYLLRPHTPSSSRVLIPLSPSSTLSECLKRRVILEFPTLYALPQAPDRLPNGYMLDSEFLGHSEKEAEELRALLSVLPAQSLNYEDRMDAGAQAGADVRGPDLDDRKIRDVLQRDLGAM